MNTLINSYETGALQLEMAVAGLSEAQLQCHPIEGNWSIHEIVCHIADFEIINAERIKRAIAEERPTIFNADPEPFAQNLNYANRVFDTEVQLIKLLRRHVSNILRGLQPDQWHRVEVHSTDGELSVEQLVNRVTSHIPHHLRFIEQKRALVR